MIDSKRMQAIRDWYGNGGSSLGHELVGELLGHIDALEAPKPEEKPKKPRRRAPRAPAEPSE